LGKGDFVGSLCSIDVMMDD